MEQAAPPQGPYKPNWFDRHKAITGLSLVFLFLLVIFPFVPKTSNDVATLGAQTGRTSPVLSQPLSSTLLPTETPTPTDIPTKAPTQPTSIYSEPTTTPLPATPQTETHQTTQQQQCTGATALCTDGTCSYSAHHQGTCSHHGGVAQWYN